MTLSAPPVGLLPPRAGNGRCRTIGHGTRPGDELVATLLEAGVRTVVDVRRFPRSRRHPQFDQDALAAELGRAGIAYRHAVELGGRRTAQPGEERFACISKPAFRSYAAWMVRAEFGGALDHALSEPAPGDTARGPKRRFVTDGSISAASSSPEPVGRPFAYPRNAGPPRFVSIYEADKRP